MNLAQLEYFSVLAKREHLTEAAASLSITPPALSNAMTHLEEELGVKLFDRIGKHIALNDAGREFLTYVDAALQQLSSGLQRIEKIRMAQTSIVTAATASPAYFRRVFELFQHDNPSIHLKWSAADLEIMLNDPTSFQQKFFLGVLSDIDPNFFEYETLITEPILIVCAQNHPFAKNHFVTTQNLRNQMFFSPGEDAPSLHKQVLELCALIDVDPATHISITNLFFRIKAISEGSGIGVTTRSGYRTNYLSADNIVCLPLIDAKIVRKQVIAWRPGTISPKEATFLEYVRRYFECMRDQ